MARPITFAPGCARSRSTKIPRSISNKIGRKKLYGHRSGLRHGGRGRDGRRYLRLPRPDLSLLQPRLSRAIQARAGKISLRLARIEISAARSRLRLPDGPRSAGVQAVRLPEVR